MPRAFGCISTVVLFAYTHKCIRDCWKCQVPKHVFYEHNASRHITHVVIVCGVTSAQRAEHLPEGQMLMPHAFGCISTVVLFAYTHKCIRDCYGACQILYDDRICTWMRSRRQSAHFHLGMRPDTPPTPLLGKLMCVVSQVRRDQLHLRVATTGGEMSVQAIIFAAALPSSARIPTSVCAPRRNVQHMRNVFILASGSYVAWHLCSSDILC